MSNISRRDFMKTAGVMTLAVAASGVLAGCSTAETPEAPTVETPKNNTVTFKSNNNESFTLTATAYDYKSDVDVTKVDNCAVVVAVTWTPTAIAENPSRAFEFASLSVDPLAHDKLTVVDAAADVPTVVADKVDIDSDNLLGSSTVVSTSSSTTTYSVGGGKKAETKYIVYKLPSGKTSSNINIKLNVYAAYAAEVAATTVTLTPDVVTIA